MTQPRIAEVQGHQHPARRTSVPSLEKRRDHQVTRNHRSAHCGDNNAVSHRATCAAETTPAAWEHAIADLG